MTGRRPSLTALFCLATAAGLPQMPCSRGTAQQAPMVDTRLLSGGVVGSPLAVRVPELTAAAPALASPHEEIKAAVRAAYAYDPPRDHPAAIPLPGDPVVSLMPKVVVHAKHADLGDGDALLSDAGLFALQAKRFMGASTRFQNPRRLEGAVPNYAVLMHRDEKRSRNMGELEDMASIMAATGDPKAAGRLRELINDTFIRQESWLEDAMDRSANGGRR